ncbi:hypothetical protein ACFY3J_22675 [Streptomyces sp. NPDC001231]|uniref:hypothetical protein n=1 Tax=Streptomyces sp. NPDC001231 TaxID=3364549 RepID=UPI0036799902
MMGADDTVEALVEAFRTDRQRLRKALTRLADGRATQQERVALRHPELRALRQGALAYLQAEARGAELVGHLGKKNQDERRALAARLDSLRKLSNTPLPHADGGEPRPLRLPLAHRAFVKVCGSAVEQELAAMGQEKGLGLAAFTPPSRDLWRWAADNGWVRNSLPPRASRLRTIPAEDFLQEVLQDADEPHLSMMHPAVVERRAAASRKVTEVRGFDVQEAFQQAKRLLRARADRHQVKQAVTELRRAAAAHARAEERNAEALVLYQDLKAQFDESGTMPSTAYQQAWHACVPRAVAWATSREPGLWQRVEAAAATHSLRTGHISRESCRHCVGSVLAILSEPKRQPKRAARSVPVSEVAKAQTEPLRTLSPVPGERLVVTSGAYRADGEAAGVAWVCDDGRKGSSRIDAGSHVDAEILAIVEAVTALASEGPLFIASGEPLAVRAVGLVLRSSHLPMDKPYRKVSSVARQQLAVLAESTAEIRVAHTGSRWKSKRKAAGRSARAVLQPLPAAKSKKTATTAEVQASDPTILLGVDADLGQPYGLNVKEDQITWSQPVTAQHLAEGWVPMPGHVGGVFDDLTQFADKIKLRVHHDGLTLRTIPGQQRVQLQTTPRGRRLSNVSWPSNLSPGTLLHCTWRRGSWELKFATKPLKLPISADGNWLTHEYDLRVLTRDGLGVTALDGLSQRQLVIRTLRGLGYLDEHGRALLAKEDLVRNVLNDAMAHRQKTTVQRVEGAIQDLLSSGRVTEVQGSRNRIGHLRYPPRAGEPKVNLLCWTPSAPRPHHDEPESEGGLPEHLLGRHGVRGHLRKIDGDASPEAADAFRRDYDLTRLVGSNVLPAGTTYVRQHERGK